jgi:hypothetical protein
MKPDSSAYLRSLARLLAEEFAPNAVDDYARTELTRHGGLLGVVDEAIDSAAAWRVEENRAMRHLFSLALQVPGLDSLATPLGVEAGGEDTELRIRSLETTNRRLRGLLTELHARLECIEGDAARALEDAIWRELSASTERRRLSLGRF